MKGRPFRLARLVGQPTQRPAIWAIDGTVTALHHFIDQLDLPETAEILGPVDLPPGARIEVSRSAEPVRLARLSSSPFTDRLVAKFDLSVHGWRGRNRSGA